MKISATLDPALMRAVDAYVAEHAGLDRSAVIDQALHLWYEREQERAIEAQYAADAAQPPADEWAAWKAIQRAAAERLLMRPDER